MTEKEEIIFLIKQTKRLLAYLKGLLKGIELKDYDRSNRQAPR